MVKRTLPAHTHMRGGLAGDEQKSYLSVLCDSASLAWLASAGGEPDCRYQPLSPLGFSPPPERCHSTPFATSLPSLGIPSVSIIPHVLAHEPIVGSMLHGDREQVAGCQMQYVSIRRRDTESWLASAHHRLRQHHNGGCRARESYPIEGTYSRGGNSGSAAWRLFVGSLHRVLCGLRCVTHHGGTCESGVRLSTGQVNVKGLGSSDPRGPRRQSE